MGLNPSLAIERARSRSRVGRKRQRSQGPVGMDLDESADVDMQPAKKRLHSSKSRWACACCHLPLIGMASQCTTAAWARRICRTKKACNPLLCAAGNALSSPGMAGRWQNVVLRLGCVERCQCPLCMVIGGASCVQVHVQGPHCKRRGAWAAVRAAGRCAEEQGCQNG